MTAPTFGGYIQNQPRGTMKERKESGKGLLSGLFRGVSSSFMDKKAEETSNMNGSAGFGGEEEEAKSALDNRRNSNLLKNESPRETMLKAMFG